MPISVLYGAFVCYCVTDKCQNALKQPDRLIYICKTENSLSQERDLENVCASECAGAFFYVCCVCGYFLNSVTLWLLKSDLDICMRIIITTPKYQFQEQRLW